MSDEFAFGIAVSDLTGLIVHEWIERSGGSEKVLDALADTFPSAQILALWNDAPDRYERSRVVETWLARTPLRRHKALALPLMPTTWRSASRTRNIDWALVSSHLFAHHFKAGPDTSAVPKFVYAHTPARYIWTPDLDARGDSSIARAASAALKPLDKRRAQEAISIAANSEYVRERIRATWDRDAVVIYPPVDVTRIRSEREWRLLLTEHERATLESLPSEFLLGASRFIPYKRLDLVISAARAVKLPVVIAGSGPEEAKLRQHAVEEGVEARFVIAPSDAMLFSLYQRATAFVFPAVEDFGIMPVEAMACGTPVIVNASGGASESVTRAGGGAVLSSFEPDAVREAMTTISTIDRSLLPDATKQFSRERFSAEVLSWMSSHVDNV